MRSASTLSLDTARLNGPLRRRAGAIIGGGGGRERGGGYPRRIEWDKVPVRKFVFDRQFDSAELGDITVADVRSEGDDLLLDIAVFGGGGWDCLLYTADAADERASVGLGGGRVR